MAQASQSLAHVRHPTTQLSGFFTFAFCVASSNSSTSFLQNSMQVRQPIHFSGSMSGCQSISSLGMPRHCFIPMLLGVLLSQFLDRRYSFLGGHFADIQWHMIF